MAEDAPHTQFKLDLPGMSLKISGDRAFVESLFREVSRDLLRVLQPPVETIHSGPTPVDLPVVDGDPRGVDFTWVYGCTPLFNKVYAVDDVDIRLSPLGTSLDPTRLRRIFIDSGAEAIFATLAAGRQTLWAEYTEEGRQTISRGAPSDEPTGQE